MNKFLKNKVLIFVAVLMASNVVLAGPSDSDFPNNFRKKATIIMYVVEGIAGVAFLTFCGVLFAGRFGNIGPCKEWFKETVADGQAPRDFSEVIRGDGLDDGLLARIGQLKKKLEGAPTPEDYQAYIKALEERLRRCNMANAFLNSSQAAVLSDPSVVHQIGKIL